MAKRTLTITIDAGWQDALRSAARTGFSAKYYEGEILNFETPGAFFSRLTSRRWAMIDALLGEGEVPLRELARRMKRDVRRVHDDATALVDLGLIERTEAGRLVCPYEDIHMDMHMRRAA